MNITRARVGVLMTPTTPLWTGTVVSSTGADSFTLTLTPKTGIVSAMIGMAVDAGGELVRIKAVDTSGTNAVLSLAENGVSSGVGGGFAAGATVNIYNVRYPMPKFQRITTNVVTVTVESGGANPFGAWRFSSTGGYSTIWWWILHTAAKLILYNDASNEDDSKIAAGRTTGAGTISLEAKNASGVGGTVVVTDAATPGTFGYVTISPFSLTKDYDITYTSLGADDTARSKAVQAPVPLVNPEAAYIPINTNIVFSAAGSFATYDGWAAGARAPATIGATGYVWDAGADSTIVSGQNSDTLTVKWSSAGFRYLKLTVTDSNSVTAVRYIPVWVSVIPFTAVSKSDLSWRLGEGWSANLEFKAPPTMLRHSLVAVIDLDTTELLFCGYVWPETFSYDFEKSTLNFTANTALAFLKNCYYYPLIVTGIKGDPENSYQYGWSNFDMLSVPRGVYFLLRWHTNFLELANAQFDVRPAVAPSALAAENRLEYIRDFTAGTLLDQLNVVAKSAMYALYGLRLGGFVVIPDLLYGSALTGVIAETGVNSDTLTLDLTAPDIVAPISYEMGAPTISDARLSGFYYDASLDFFPIVVRAPSHPGSYGTPAEIPNLIANGPGYAEMLRWAGRHIGLANLARKYTLRSLVDVDPKTYKMIDIPDPTNSLAQIRIVVEEETLQLDAEALTWNLKIGGRTFGTTADACVEPPNPPPTVPPVIPPVPALPLSSTLVMHNYKHVLRCANFFEVDDIPVWEEITVTGFSAANDTIYSLAIDPDGKGAWIVTAGSDQSTTGVFRCDDITTGSFAITALTAHNGMDLSIAKKTELGMPGPTGYSQFRSIISMGNGIACTHETGGDSDRAPTVAFATSNKGVSWTASVPYYNTSGWWGNAAFWAFTYFDTPCYQIDWDGSQVVIVGDKKDTHGSPGEYQAAYVSSPDGINWTLHPVGNANSQLASCNVVGGTIYCYSRSRGALVTVSGSATAPFSPVLSYSFGFRRTQYDGEIVYIRHATVANNNTELCLGNVVQLISGGSAATVSVVNGGTGGTYAPGDVLTLVAPDGGTSATVTVLTVAGDDVATVSLTTPGTAYNVGTYATTGGGGTGCTIGVVTLTDAIPRFGIARVLGMGEFVLASRDAVAVGVVSVYIVNGVIYDRTGNLLSVIGGAGWEGTMRANNAVDASGIEVIEVST